MVNYLVISLLVLFGTLVVFTFLLLLRAIFSIYMATIHAHFEKEINLRSQELFKEREKLVNILHRVLPRETLCEIQRTGRVENKEWPQCTVLFSDVVNFSAIVEAENSVALMDFLDRYIFDLDGIGDRLKVEKIKVIGDAYMCVAGMEKYDKANPVRVVLMAMEMLDTLERLNKEYHIESEHWGIRIGIATGTVISGVLGRNRLSLDVWGHTVNTAKRMESASEEARINITEDTYNVVNGFFDCENRGKLTTKNGKQVLMYFVNGIVPELSENGEGKKPNALFQTRYQLLHLADLNEYVFDWLEKKLPKNLYYHNTRHTQDVVLRVREIGELEGVSEEDLLILQTAALLHDSGHIISYDEHERLGADVAYQLLPNFGYSHAQIERVVRLIMATKMPVHPTNLLECIICDADLDYLGRLDYASGAHNLYRELRERGLVGDEAEWVGKQIEFINRHQYYTVSAQQRRELPKQQQLKELAEWQKRAEQESERILEHI